jgi:23S rRNA (guanine745-N1)-methyltransferase
VATNKRIPIQDHSCDVVLSIFGFPVYPEFHRILKPNSQLLLCHQGPDHLIEIRQILYPTIKDKPTQNKPCPFSDYFSVTDHSTKTEIKSGLSADMLTKLVHMTPHAYRATRENLQKLYDNPPDTITVQSVITSFRAK